MSLSSLSPINVPKFPQLDSRELSVEKVENAAKSAKFPFVIYDNPIPTTIERANLLESELDPGIETRNKIEQEFTFGIENSERDFWLEVFRVSKRCSSPRLHAFSSCGTNAWCEHHAETDNWRIVTNSCGDRLCPKCGIRRRMKTQERIREGVRSLRKADLLFITLTVVHDSESELSERIDHLVKSFRKLRQRKFWKSNVLGGLAVIEIKRTKKNEWHPHLHALAYVPKSFLDARELSTNWLSVTKDSKIVHVRKIASKERAVEYVAKYATKPFSVSSFDFDLQLGIEAFEAISNRRLLIVFGTIILPPETKAESQIGWKRKFPLWLILALAERKVSWANEIIARAIGPPKN